MKILVLSSRDHFHSPIVLRNLKSKRPNDEIILATTPKLGIKGSFLDKISRIIKESGCDYLVSQMILKFCFGLLGFIERFILGKSFSERNYFTIKEAACYLKLKHLDLNDINSPKSVSRLKELKPDLIITIFFNQILKKNILSVPEYGSLNIHPSYLPKYRGFSPCFWVLVNNESKTGVSLHRLIRGLDKGMLLLRQKIFIDSEDTFFTLYRKCALRATDDIDTVFKSVTDISHGELQDESRATYFPVISARAVREFRKNKRKFGWLF